MLVALVATTLALTGFLVAAAPSDDGAAAGATSRIDGYPQRIGFERPSARLPARPGPLAATLFDNAFGTSRYLGVTSRGQLYELPVGPNVLSPDGSLLLTTEVDGDESMLAVHDLTTGDVRVFDDIGQSLLSSEIRVAPYRLDSLSPVHWSPDGSLVLARFRGGGKGTEGHARLLDVTSGALTDIGAGTPAGFLPSGAAVIVSAKASGGVVVTTVDAPTGATSRTSLQLAGPWRAESGARPGAGVSPDGMLVLVDTAGQGGGAALRLFSLPGGTELPARRISRWDGCTPSWLDGDPVLPTATRGYGGSLSAGAELVTTSGSRPLVAVHHRMQSSCLQLTADALRAGPHRSFLGTSTALWTWYWWQLLLVGSLTSIVLGLVARHVVRERRRRAASQGT